VIIMNNKPFKREKNNHFAFKNLLKTIEMRNC